LLRSLHIRDFAIIEDLQLEFAAGFNVLTGETGAGKSIIMQALDLVCGGRASPDDVRAGADEAVIEALFELSEAEIQALACGGVTPREDMQIRRVVSRAGKSRVHLDGAPSSVGVLGQIGGRLLHVYGQHEQAVLLRADSHLDLLDTYAAHPELTATMAAAYDCLREAVAERDRLRQGRETAEQRMELVRFQQDELATADVRPGEDEELRLEKDKLAHAEKLLQICRQGEEALYSGDQAVTAVLGRVAAHLRDAARIDPTFGGTIELLVAAGAQVEEAAASLRDYAGDVSFDADRREALEERWALLQRLIRKYGGSIESVLESQADLEAELRGLEGQGTDLEALERGVAAAADAAWKAAAALSASRRTRARYLEKGVTRELQALGMSGGVFGVSFLSAPPEPVPGSAGPFGGAGGVTLDRGGADGVEFQFSGNPGEPPRPLARVASGGELSRIMLALKVLTAGRGEVATLVFDEVDAGIGGAIADAVGARLRTLGESRQILCISHLPQIAARADHHFVVEKQVRQGRTVSAARPLDRDERVTELARMLGGADDAEAARWARRLVSSRR
jgi:DNA repair protein RecN (Recombination protein N)